MFYSQLYYQLKYLIYNVEFLTILEQICLLLNQVNQINCQVLFLLVKHYMFLTPK